MKKVIVFGTFDGLHEGHLNFFEQAREYGDYLLVVIGRDSTVVNVKKRLPKHNEKERLSSVLRCGLVDEARLGNEGTSPYKVIEETKPDIICLGYDQIYFTDKLESALKNMGLENIEIKRLKAYKPEIYHSSIINNK